MFPHLAVKRVGHVKGGKHTVQADNFAHVGGGLPVRMLSRVLTGGSEGMWTSWVRWWSSRARCVGRRSCRGAAGCLFGAGTGDGPGLGLVGRLEFALVPRACSE